MKVKIILCLVLCVLGLFQNLSAQNKFVIIKGIKANYSIEIPEGFFDNESIGVNVDLKYVARDGSSIVTTVKQLPKGISDDQILNLDNISAQQITSQFRANGMEGFELINKGLITINNKKTFFLYYTDGILYYHTVNQYNSGKVINLTFTCSITKKGYYMPYIYRVTNSLK